MHGNHECYLNLDESMHEIYGCCDLDCSSLYYASCDSRDFTTNCKIPFQLIPKCNKILQQIHAIKISDAGSGLCRDADANIR